MAESGSSVEFSGSLTSSTLPPPRTRIFKIIVIGDSGVGKTCLTYRFCAGKFPDKTEATIGVDFRERLVEIDGEKIKVQMCLRVSGLFTCGGKSKTVWEVGESRDTWSVSLSRHKSWNTSLRVSAYQQTYLDQVLLQHLNALLKGMTMVINEGIIPFFLLAQWPLAPCLDEPLLTENSSGQMTADPSYGPTLTLTS